MRFCLFVALALFAVGCSDQGAAQDADAPVKILTSQMYVTLRNDSGAPLSDVTVSIVPVGRQTVYNKYVGRLESSRVPQCHARGFPRARRNAVQPAGRQAAIG